MTSTTLLISTKVSGGFNNELVNMAHDNVRRNMLRDTILRIQSSKIQTPLKKEQFLGDNDTPYHTLIDELMTYEGEPKVFKIPAGFLNIHTNTSTNEIRTDVRSNTLGEAKYLNLHGANPLSEANIFTEETKAVSTEITAVRSNAIFGSSFSLVSPQMKLGGNTKLLKLLESMTDNSTTTDVVLGDFKESEPMRDLIHVISLHHFEISINKNTPKNSIERLRVIFGQIQAYLNKLDDNIVVIRNQLKKLENGSFKPEAFVYSLIPSRIVKKGGTVVMHQQVSTEGCTLNMEFLKNGFYSSFAFYNHNDTNILRIMTDFFKTYGYTTMVSLPIKAPTTKAHKAVASTTEEVSVVEETQEKTKATPGANPVMKQYFRGRGGKRN